MLAKLEWNKLTPSERQIRDVQEVAKAQWLTLDIAYLGKWGKKLELGVAEQLRRSVARFAESGPKEAETIGQDYLQKNYGTNDLQGDVARTAVT